MTVLTLHANGKADPAEAWERYVVPARWPEWSPQISRVETEAERLVPGACGRVVGPLGASADFVVDVVDEHARRWAWSVRRGPLHARLEHLVRPRELGCSTALTLDAPLPIVVAYAPLALLAMHRLVARR